MGGVSQHKAMLVNQNYPVYRCNSGSWNKNQKTATKNQPNKTKTKTNKIKTTKIPTKTNNNKATNKPTKQTTKQKLCLQKKAFPWKGHGSYTSITVTLAHEKMIPGSFLIFLLSLFNCEILQIIFPIWTVPGFSRTFVNAFISPQWVQSSFLSIAFSLQAGTTCWACIPRDCIMQ